METLEQFAKEIMEDGAMKEFNSVLKDIESDIEYHKKNGNKMGQRIAKSRYERLTHAGDYMVNFYQRGEAEINEKQLELNRCVTLTYKLSTFLEVLGYPSPEVATFHPETIAFMRKHWEEFKKKDITSLKSLNYNMYQIALNTGKFPITMQEFTEALNK